MSSILPFLKPRRIILVFKIYNHLFVHLQLIYWIVLILKIKRAVTEHKTATPAITNHIATGKRNKIKFNLKYYLHVKIVLKIK